MLCEDHALCKELCGEARNEEIPCEGGGCERVGPRQDGMLAAHVRLWNGHREGGALSLRLQRAPAHSVWAQTLQERNVTVVRHTRRCEAAKALAAAATQDTDDKHSPRQTLKKAGTLVRMGSFACGGRGRAACCKRERSCYLVILS